MNHKIKLFIHDSFFDAFAKLPKKLQKKTREFTKKFRENPTSDAINYEKISTFKDQSLRTVRVDQKYRAIVRAPETGDGYHLLWVDNHDEAMDWAKNKVFEWNDNTRTFQLYNVETVDTPVVTPQIQLDSEPSPLADLGEKVLLEIGTPSHMLEKVSSLRTANELLAIKDQLPVDNYEYLYYLLEGISLEEVLEEINEGKQAEEGAEVSDNAKKHVYLLTDDDDLERILSGDFAKWKIFLHPSQRKLSYRKYNGAVKVTGGAGTGKTVCALHRAKYLVDQLGAFDKPLLFTTYTKSLTEYLRSTIQDLGVPEDFIQITNIDKLAFSLAKEMGVIDQEAGFILEDQEKRVWEEVLQYLPSTKDESFLSEEYNEVILRNNVKSLEEYLKTPRLGRSARIGRKDKVEAWKLIEEFKKRKHPNFSKLEVCNLLIDHLQQEKDKPFSHLVCDEVQDFSNVELKLLRSLVQEGDNDLFFVGDPLQNIYNKKINFSQSNINVRGRRSKKLLLNYRTTEEIKQQALKAVDQLSFDDFDGGEESTTGYVSLMHGEQPIYQVFQTEEAEDKYLIDSLNQFITVDAFDPSNICICSRTNHGVDDIKKLLQKEGIKYTDLSSSSSSPHAVKVSSFHNLKGHEFKILFVVDVSQTTVPYKHRSYSLYTEKEKEDYIKQEKSLLYVVMTRAIQTLCITGVGEKSGWL